MKKIIPVLLFATALACNDASENNAATETTAADSSLHREDGTVNADTIDRRTDGRLDKGVDTLR